jgi:glycosyltransferase involved in cell wall biosynthesis
MKKKLLVSMPVYNLEKYVGEAIESVLSQTYENFDLVIVEDCSTDGSYDVIQKYVTDSRVTVVRNKINGGCFYSKNTGIKGMETGNYDLFTTHDSDDTSDPKRFEKIIEIFDDETIIGSMTGETRIGGEVPDWFGEVTKSTEAHAFYSKIAFNTLGYFDNSLFFADVDYWRRAQLLLAISPKFKLSYSDEIMYFANMTGSNMITTYNLKNRFRYDSYSKYRLGRLAKTKDLYFPYFEIENSAKVKGVTVIDSSSKH